MHLHEFLLVDVEIVGCEQMEIEGRPFIGGILA